MAIYSINGGAGSPVAGAIRDAAQSTGTSFEYLLTTAQIESNLNPAAQAATSSAKGLYQFIEQTWLATMKQAGRRSALPAMPRPSCRRRTGNTRCRMRPRARRSCGCAVTRR
jgi:soluble lytic murein transglycosylase-like protein